MRRSKIERQSNDGVLGPHQSVSASNGRVGTSIKKRSTSVEGWFCSFFFWIGDAKRRQRRRDGRIRFDLFIGFDRVFDWIGGHFRWVFIGGYFGRTFPAQRYQFNHFLTWFHRFLSDATGFSSARQCWHDVSASSSHIPSTIDWLDWIKFKLVWLGLGWTELGSSILGVSATAHGWHGLGPVASLAQSVNLN